MTGIQKNLIALLALTCISCTGAPVLDSFPEAGDRKTAGCFPLTEENAANIVYDTADFKVVEITAGMLADDIELVTGKRPATSAAATLSDIPAEPSVVAGTAGNSALIDALAESGVLEISEIDGKWESFVIQTVRHPEYGTPLLVIAGSDRRGTAFGLTSLSKAIGVSPWYWWADVTPGHKDALFVRRGRFVQKEPSVQYRGIFINDERFGGWARWVENTFDTQTGQVGPKVYRKVFELLLRLGGNYLWPAMHNGSKAFNANPENARLADDYAIVMGSSHCEQMLRNNEDEWKNAGTYGDFNYITNRQTMIDYWEERVRTNGKYENTYSLGLRGIHDYPMEGAATTQERVALMQKALDDQRDILQRNISAPIEQIPQVLCTYEEVLDAYKNGLQVPDDVTLLWSDDKHGYTRNLSNPEEMKRSGGAGIYYHLSYHGDPASWIWLSPLSPAFISTELTKAYTYGARRIWVFNVGDIKPAEKELTFAMELAWDIDRWTPEKAHGFIKEWAAQTFGDSVAEEISDIQDDYYALMASGKDSHVWFIDFPEDHIRERLAKWRKTAEKAEALKTRIPEELQPAYFELVLYPVCGAWMINEYQLLARTSLALASEGDNAPALSDAARSLEMYKGLDSLTKHYNEELLDGKWREFFNWKPYHWFRSDVVDAPMATPELISEIAAMPAPGHLDAGAALSQEGVSVFASSEGDIPLWIKALSPIRNFSKAPEDNVFCHVETAFQSFDASATPINNIWHSPYVGPMWSKVGTIHLPEGESRLFVTELKQGARIDDIFIGAWPPFPAPPVIKVAASDFRKAFTPEKSERINVIPQLGFSNGVVVLPFDTPSYELTDSHPYVEYELNFPQGASRLEVRTLANLHVYEGRGARYAVQIDGQHAELFDIHTGDFTAEWRWNVLRGYSCRSVDISGMECGKHRVRISLLDPGIVLQEICIFRD
mgnify:CR=1 FL=1